MGKENNLTSKFPSRFTDDEDYFEYGCDRKDGLMSKEGFFKERAILSACATKSLYKRLIIIRGNSHGE